MGVDVAVERGLGDVDADDDREDGDAGRGLENGIVLHGGFPALRMRTAARGDAFDRLFGLSTLDRRRSRSVTASWTPGHDRSAGGRRFAGFSLRFEAREAACWIGHDFTVFLNIQGTKTRRKCRGELTTEGTESTEEVTEKSEGDGGTTLSS